MENKRPAISENIKRIVRQRCGFGCVLCGNPVIDYDHIEEYNIVKEHAEENLTLLCPEHHREKTAGRLPKELVIKNNKNPFNLRENKTGQNNLFYYGNEATIIMGGNKFYTKDSGNTSILIPLVIFEKIPIHFRLENNELLLNVKLRDRNDDIIFLIENNQLKTSIGVWDFEYFGKKLIIREKKKSIFIEIEFLPPNNINFKRGRIFCKGKFFELSDKKGLAYNGKGIDMGFNNCTFNSQIGIVLDYEFKDFNGGFFLQVAKD
ncbi:HNH endonuclease signature motif containing protein [Chryseobacterium daeguense]|uniref:HNH endonuclease signature motif containing protein n=1 Tax=Chryseobacterium daeguense TaxID=412438 RepID=UPI0003F9D36B|nr:HNH endonuclease signature motif containing protein [Chryseobacterium daeguense]